MITIKASTGISVFVMASLLSGYSVTGQTAAGTCSSEKSHEFDFWIGSWKVMSGGNLAGHNVIEPILGGCVLQETWSGAGGSAGSSFNYFNPQLGKWQQFWVWRNGTTLYLTGEYAEGKMTLSGDSKNQQGQTVSNRVTWFDNDDGTVRQFWEVSSDGGASWSTAFDGLYTRDETQ